jgi:hypothetical protein
MNHECNTEDVLFFVFKSVSRANMKVPPLLLIHFEKENFGFAEKSPKTDDTCKQKMLPCSQTPSLDTKQHIHSITHD